MVGNTWFLFYLKGYTVDALPPNAKSETCGKKLIPRKQNFYLFKDNNNDLDYRKEHRKPDIYDSQTALCFFK